MPVDKKCTDGFSALDVANGDALTSLASPLGVAMATNKPRITITLTERQHEVLSSISRHSGKSMSSSVSELVEAALPVFERMAVTFQKLDGWQSQQSQKLGKDLDKIQDKLGPLVDSMIGQLELVMDAVQSDLGATSLATLGAGRSSRTSPSASGQNLSGRPPHGNTGVNHIRKPHPDVKPLSKKTVGEKA